MSEYVLIFALILAGASMPLQGSLVECRTTIAIMLGLLAGSALTAAGLPFSPFAWLVIDFVSIGIIFSARTSFRDRLVFALFFLAWPTYFTDAEWAGPASTYVVCAQLFVSLPWHKFYERAGRTTARVAEKDDFDLRVSGVGHGR